MLRKAEVPTAGLRVFSIHIEAAHDSVVQNIAPICSVERSSYIQVVDTQRFTNKSAVESTDPWHSEVNIAVHITVTGSVSQLHKHLSASDLWPCLRSIPTPEPLQLIPFSSTGKAGTMATIRLSLTGGV